MGLDLLCIDENYPENDIAYFNKHGIVWPKSEKVYSVREIIKYPVGEVGVLLNEIKNPPTPKISPSFGMKGNSEQAWKISRFRNLDGSEIKKEEINSIKEKA